MRRTPLATIASNLKARRHPLYPRMDMYEYNLNHILGMLHQNGCSNISIELTDHDFLGCMIYATKGSIPAGKSDANWF
jgi:hypothetical protein